MELELRGTGKKLGGGGQRIFFSSLTQDKVFCALEFEAGALPYQINMAALQRMNGQRGKGGIPRPVRKLCRGQEGKMVAWTRIVAVGMDRRESVF